MPPIAYRHVGKQHWIHDGKVWMEVAWYNRISRSLIDALKKIVTDHSMNRYISNKIYWQKLAIKKKSVKRNSDS